MSLLNIRLLLLGAMVAASAYATSTFTVAVDDFGGQLTLSQFADVSGKFSNTRFVDAFAVDFGIDRNAAVQDPHSPAGASLLAASLLDSRAMESTAPAQPKPGTLTSAKLLVRKTY